MSSMEKPYHRMKRMKITNFQSYLDKEGNVNKRMVQKEREYASFLALIIDSTTDFTLTCGFETDIRCFCKGCPETIQSSIDINGAYNIRWFCAGCDAEGEISGWEGTKWDNSTERLETYEVIEIH